MQGSQRSVVILEIVFRYAKISPDAILHAEGIIPYLPYSYEHIVVDGAPAHRYTQPPRPRRRLTEDVSHSG